MSLFAGVEEMLEFLVLREKRYWEQQGGPHSKVLAEGMVGKEVQWYPLLQDEFIKAIKQ